MRCEVGTYGVEPYRGEQLQWTNGEARLSFLDSPSSTARYVRIALWEINMVDRVSVVVNGVVLLDRVAPWQGSWVGHIPPATVVKNDIVISSPTAQPVGDRRTLGVAIRAVEVMK